MGLKKEIMMTIENPFNRDSKIQLGLKLTLKILGMMMTIIIIPGMMMTKAMIMMTF